LEAITEIKNSVKRYKKCQAGKIKPNIKTTIISSSPKAPLLSAITLEVRASTRNFGGHNSIHSRFSMENCEKK
jgi:hypothetical protein